MRKIGKFTIAGILTVLCALSLTACGLFGGGGGGGTQTPKSVTVTLNPNGGTVDKLTFIGEAGSVMALPDPARSGYTFDSWYNGWGVISNTVFPSSDITLTARYYADRDSGRTVNSIPTELNKVYDANASWNENWFSAADWQCIEYLKKNITTEITVTVTLERQATTSFGGSVWFILSGADRADIIATSPKLYKNDTYEEFSLSGTTTAKILAGNASTIIILRIDSDLGSQHLRFRNINISIAYTEKAGTLV